MIYLTTGGMTNGPTGAGNAYQNIDVILGTTLGDDPRIAPLFMDLWSQPGTSGGVWINNSIPGKFVVTWERMVEWWATTQAGAVPTFTFQAQIFDTGDVWFYYDSSVASSINPAQNQVVCGVSRGDGVADPGSADLSVSGAQNLTDFALYESFPIGPGLFDLNASSVQFIWAGTGFIQVATSCVPAFHEPYGAGCYEFSDSFYELHEDATLAAPELTGQSVLMTPIANEFLVQWGGVSYIAPTGAAQPVFAAATDDGETVLTPTAPFPTSTGPQATLNVHSNGVISWGAQPQTFPNTNAYTPTPGGALDGVNTGIYAWHDYSETGAGSGRIVSEEVFVGSDLVLVITWDGVNSWPLTATNPSEMQFQFNLTTGTIAMVFQSISNDATSQFGSGHLIGYSPAGVSIDAGETDLSAAAPFTTSPNNVAAMSLSATGAPVSSGTTGATITYTTDGLTDFAPGVVIGLNILSLGQSPGLDLGFLGAGGCNAYITSLDLTQTMIGPGASQSVSLTLPTGLPQGFEIFSQSICLIQPNSLPNGQNAFGLL
ncbi:MAG: hypothetical protein AB8H80_21275, partial [Planctomycetota bacterium]